VALRPLTELGQHGFTEPALRQAQDRDDVQLMCISVDPSLHKLSQDFVCSEAFSSETQSNREVNEQNALIVIGRSWLPGTGVQGHELLVSYVLQALRVCDPAPWLVHTARGTGRGYPHSEPAGNGQHEQRCGDQHSSPPQYIMREGSAVLHSATTTQ
jgi:hypothetical protein